MGWLFYHHSTKLLVEDALEEITTVVLDTEDTLQRLVSTYAEDVLFLSNTPPIQGILRAKAGGGLDRKSNTTYTQWTKQLGTIFDSWLQRKSSYLSVRYINNKGKELVHVSRNGKKIINHHGKQLQNKAHRNYVIETLKQTKGSLYVSEINLNREFGKVTEPRLEVIRSATPIFDDSDGKIAGLVVVTAKVGHELRNIEKRVLQKSPSETIYITNDRGGYLLHPNRSKSYGFDLGNNYSIQEDIPQLASLYVKGNQETQKLLLPAEVDGENVVSFTKIAFNPLHPKRFIAVIITQNYADILVRQSDVLNDVVILAVFLTVLGASIGIFFSFRVSQPINQITMAVDDFSNYRPIKLSLPDNNQDEIGILARSFKLMIKQVQESRNNLQDMNSNLEKRILERTQMLEESEARQRTILETAVDGIITITEKGIIQSTNPAAEKMFGYDRKEMIGKNVKMLMPESYAVKHDGFLANYVSSGDKKIIGIGREVEGLRKEGSTFPMDLAVSEMEFDGERMFTGIVRDITERKRLERMKAEFISTVSHELRTPLTSIRGALNLVIGKVGDKIEGKPKRMLEMAERNSERLTLLINDILDLEKIESGSLAFEFKKLDIIKLTRQAIDENEGYSQKHGVVLKLNTSLENASVFGDQNRLLQVYANLISNAVKFSQAGEQVEIIVEGNNDSYRVAVQDHGSGIPESFHNRIFQRFAQADSSDTREKGGTGLGLSITKAIVERHGGKIDFETEQGKGTKFYFDLTKELSSTSLHDNNKSGPRVLICEDDEDIAMLLAEIVRPEGVNCDIAMTMHDAQALLQKNTYQLLLLDLILPDGDGLDFLHNLRADSATAELPVVVVSVRAEEGRKEFNGDAVSVLDWLQKPVDENRLLKSVRDAMKQSNRPRILHVEDDPDIIQVVRTLLEDTAELDAAANLNDARRLLGEFDFDLVILDLELADGSGDELLDDIKRCCPVLIFSASAPPKEVAKRVSAALTKSMTNNDELLKIIKDALRTINKGVNS
ncbi:MAG: PAS domain S-box protein [Gammaproteobacteria bacterium]|nr:PAS domain S-box protein [Gammaproteobacteria bacterium]